MSSTVTRKIGVDMNLRELITEYILFACDEDTLIREFGITEDEVANLSDLDLLELYDATLLTPLER